jgi:hypothetical protein
MTQSGRPVLRQQGARKDSPDDPECCGSTRAGEALPRLPRRTGFGEVRTGVSAMVRNPRDSAPRTCYVPRYPVAGPRRTGAVRGAGLVQSLGSVARSEVRAPARLAPETAPLASWRHG